MKQVYFVSRFTLRAPLPPRAVNVQHVDRPPASTSFSASKPILAQGCAPGQPGLGCGEAKWSERMGGTSFAAEEVSNWDREDSFHVRVIVAKGVRSELLMQHV